MADDKSFLDTNILVYAYDTSAGKKHEMCKELVVRLWKNRLGCISTQVLQEFFVIVTGRIPKPLDAKSAREIVRDLVQWDVVVNDEESILNAIEIHLRYKYSFWDCMIVSAAVNSNSSSLFTEDLTDGQIINSLTIRNPFQKES